MLPSIEQANVEGGVPSARRNLRYKTELALLFAKGTPVRLTADGRALAAGKYRGGLTKVYTGVVTRNPTIQNIWAGQIPIRLTGSRYTKLRQAHFWEPDPNPPKDEPPPPPVKRLKKKKVEEVVVAPPPPAKPKPKRLEDLIFWEANPVEEGIMTLNTVIAHLSHAVEAMPKDWLSAEDKDTLAQAVSSAKLYLDRA